MGRYGFVTRFEARAPLAVIRDAVARPQTWVGDATGFVTFTLLADGDPAGQGARFDASVRAPLGYHLAAVVAVDRVEPERVDLSLEGDLVGTATWHLEEARGVTAAELLLDVSTTPTWMDRLEPVARPVFERSHGVVMRQAVRTACRSLGVDLVHVASRTAR